MQSKKGLHVAVEIANIVLYWQCPQCDTDNGDEIKRPGTLPEELECEHCTAIIARKGNVEWVVK